MKLFFDCHYINIGLDTKGAKLSQHFNFIELTLPESNNVITIIK